MNSPGLYPLCDLAVTAAATQVAVPFTGLTGTLACALQLSFKYGSGGASCRAYVQTSLDGGQTWIDIACALFGTAGKTVLFNLSALTPKTTEVVPTDGALADDTAIDGVLGDQLRVKIVSTGTYGGSTLISARAELR